MSKSLHSQFDKQLSVLWTSLYEAGKVKGCQNELTKMGKNSKTSEEIVDKVYKEAMEHLQNVTKTFNKMIDPRDMAIVKMRLKINPKGQNTLRDSEISENENFTKVLLDVVTSFYMEGINYGARELLKKANKPYLHLEKEEKKLLEERKMNLTVFSNTFYGLLQSRDNIIEKLQNHIKYSKTK